MISTIGLEVLLQRVIFVLLLLLHGCDIDDIKGKIDNDSNVASGVENINAESNKSSLEQAAQESECYDWQTDCMQQTGSVDGDIQETTEETTEEQKQEGEDSDTSKDDDTNQTIQEDITIDPNACDDNNGDFSTIVDSFSTPEGDSKYGIYFSSKVTPPNIDLTLYFEKEDNLVGDSIEYATYKDDNLEFKLSTDSAYFNGKNIYIKRSDTMKCYRSKFTDNKLGAAVLDSFIEVRKSNQ